MFYLANALRLVFWGPLNFVSCRKFYDYLLKAVKFVNCLGKYPLLNKRFGIYFRDNIIKVSDIILQILNQTLF